MAFETLSTPVDLYCERLSPSFWAEPVNALTNAAFLVAAVLAARAVAGRGGPAAGPWVLVALMALIGLGSFAFHTLATRGAALLDVIPIGLFVAAALALFGRRGLHWGWPASLTLILAVIAAGAALSAVVQGLFGPLPQPFAGSLTYVAPLLAVALAGLALRLAAARARAFARFGKNRSYGAASAAPSEADLTAREAAGRRLQLAALVFALSLTARSLDLVACTVSPIGTHFLWHALNAVVLYLVTTALAGLPPPQAAGTSTRERAE